jgi:hypothetical protein
LQYSSGYICQCENFIYFNRTIETQRVGYEWNGFYFLQFVKCWYDRPDCSNSGQMTSGSNSRNCASPRSAFSIFFPLLDTWLFTTPSKIRQLAPNCHWYPDCECGYKPRLCNNSFFNLPPYSLKTNQNIYLINFS